MHSKIKYDVGIWLCAFLVLAAMMPARFALSGEVAVIEVKYRRAAELEPIIKSLLSADGKVTVSQRTNSFVIVDSPEAIQRVHAYLERFDRAVEQVRINVRFHTDGEDNERTVAAGGRVSNDNVSIAAGGRKKDGVDVSVRDRRYRRQSYSKAFVVAMSGSPAYIRSGYQIPYNRSTTFHKRYGPRYGTVTWQNVESGFEVTPTIVGDRVHLKIVPRLSYDHRQDAVVRFFEARTEVTAEFGQWVEISGATEQKNEIFREILSRNKSAGNTATGMSVMVEKP